MANYRGKSRHNHDQPPTERSSTQNLKAVIRKMNKENERLRKELKRRGDVSTEYAELLQEVEQVESPPSKRADACPECGKGAVKSTALGKFTFEKCDSCKYRKVLK